MSDKDFSDFHQHLAELMIAEVQSWGGELKPEGFEKLERLALGAVVPEMLASYLAVLAAESRSHAAVVVARAQTAQSIARGPTLHRCPP
jgi:hypothetical protein